MIAQYMIWSCVCVSVSLSQVGVSFYRNGWMAPAGFWHRSYLSLILHCIATEFRYLLKIRVHPSATWSQTLNLAVFMAALHSRCGHYISGRWFYPFSSIFFSRLISAVGNWMSTILPHMMWPLCEFRMQVWNVLHAARWKCRTQKIAKNSPSGHHHTPFSGYIFATKACMDNRKNLLSINISSRCPHNMVNMPTSGWDRLTSLGYACKFQLVSRLCSVTARHLVVGVSQTLRRWTEGATYIRQGDHHVGHWPTF